MKMDAYGFSFVALLLNLYIFANIFSLATGGLPINKQFDIFRGQILTSDSPVQQIASYYGKQFDY